MHFFPTMARRGKPRCARVWSLLCVGLSFVWVAPPREAAAKVEISTRADGLKVIHNENEVQRSRRHSATLVEIPRAELGAIIDRHARQRKLEPKLVRALIQTESGYNARALSAKGAMGLMQLMPETARELKVSDPYNAEQNVRGGTAYLRRLIDRFGGKLELGLAAYNAGPTAVERYDGIPPFQETRQYVRRVMRLYAGREVVIPTHFLGTTQPAKGHKPVWVQQDGRMVLTTDPP